MCLATPCKVVEYIDEDIARVQVGDSETFIKCACMLLPEKPELGQYVLVHAGFAINVVEEEEARKTLDLLREMSELTGVKPVGNTAFDLSE
ncbi:HypC/HybG/HupF family hydrogenase formation chaperone [Desulfocurvus sp.]|jgi:hydrogenase expression/formation protein HypC|uniref:HypC/HybG/HupF family hydrogenase formation chaperone n=1 Tax=Desulfocurvus sp. TaxID=2871698 RepID=UPI0025BAFE69|nr:HypC/HybG/HupF family hydrogenase formation chaperone [Desulfocurvus sp.]MCK9239153.1 HypC/HybG/HupF family hydrogenase formation chaperone [Desulfocurvus sp.]